MRTGHLFAGIDGIGLGLAPHGFEHAWFVENEPAPSAVLARHYPHVPNHGDITAVDWTQVEPVDVLTGGFPCQDVSKAGRGAGIKEGTRSGLWYAYADAVRVLRPRLVIVENVAALRVRGLDIVLGDLAELGFDAWWTSLRASDVGAAHRRERLFIVAHVADGDSVRHVHGGAGVEPAAAGVDALGHAPAGDHVAPADGYGDGLARVGGVGTVGRDADRRPCAGQAATDWGEFGPAVRRWERVLGRPAPPPVDGAGRPCPDFVEWHMGFPAGWTFGLSKTDRLKALGNAVVPQCADLIGRWALDLLAAEVAA